ncbi:type II secretion system F family protein [Bacillus tianshenii]|nr:type II secretion system F family protein [Bacillus tianshenii]
MDSLIITTVVLFLLCFIVFLKEWYRYLNEKQQLMEHVHHVAGDQLQAIKRKQTTTQLALKKLLRLADDYASIGKRVNFFSESHEIESLLLRAGNPLDLTVDRFQGTKIVLGLIGLLAGVVFFVIGFPFSQYGIVILPLAGYMTPILLLRQKAKARQEQIRYDLPEFLDTVSVTLQAGAGLDHSLREVIRFFEGPLREEFARFNQELDLGLPREKAYEQLLRRNDNPEFQILIKALIQGGRLGVPVATTFKIQSENMRKLRKELVKEKAAKASPKVTLITTLIVAPTAVLMIAGLMVLNILKDGDFITNLFN